jgi:hypothetical protein
MLINYKAGPPSTIPTCYKDFYDKALLPICGHPLFDNFKYCQKGAFYNNKNYDNFDKVNGNFQKYFWHELTECQFFLILLMGIIFIKN